MNNAVNCDKPASIFQTVKAPKYLITPVASYNKPVTNKVFGNSLVVKKFVADKKKDPKSAVVANAVPYKGIRFALDQLQEQRKRERARRRRLNRPQAISTPLHVEVEVKRIVDLMRKAAADDRESNIKRRPAVEKVKLLPVVKKLLLRVDYYEALIEGNVISVITEWLSPLPDQSLPSFDVRLMLLNLLSRWTSLELSMVKQSGLGKAVMVLSSHPKENRQNKETALKIIQRWSKSLLQDDGSDKKETKCHDLRSKRRGENTRTSVNPLKAPITKIRPTPVQESPSNSEFFKIFNIKR